METVPCSAMPSVRKTDTLLSGHLYIVATPIGNLKDITMRALEVLSGVDCVAAEDTRNTARLLAFFHIQKPLVSLHEHNEMKRTPELIDALSRGKTVALVSDAGTPTLSDPGFLLVRAAIASGIPLVPVPGVSAAMTLMCVSGLPTDRVLFCGFPPKKSGRRRRWLQELAGWASPMIFYVSPHGIVSFLAELQEALGDRHAVLGREMTKLYEEFLRGRLSELERILEDRDRVRGECCLMVDGAGPETREDQEAEEGLDVDARILKALKAGEARPAHLAKKLAADLGMDRRMLYGRIVAMQAENSG